MSWEVRVGFGKGHIGRTVAVTWDKHSESIFAERKLIGSSRFENLARDQANRWANRQPTDHTTPYLLAS